MDVESARQSSLRDHGSRYTPPVFKENFTKGYTAAPTMSTAAIMNPVAYTNSSRQHPEGPPPPYRSTVPAQAPPHALTGLVSPATTDSRRTSDDVKDLPRLPSIAEAIGPSTTDTRPPFPSYAGIPPPPPPPQSHSYGPSYQPAASMSSAQRFPPDPSPYASHFERPMPRRSSPPPTNSQGGHPREAPSSAYPASHHQAAVVRNGPQTHSPSHSPGPILYSRGSPRREEPGFRYDRSDQLGPSTIYNGSLQAPREQYRGYPTAPPPTSYVPERSSYERLPPRPEEFAPKRPTAKYDGPYESTLKRNLDVWEIEQNLELVRDSSAKLAHMSHEALAVAQRYNRTPGTDNNPALSSCDAMLREAEIARSNLLMIRNALIEQENILAEQKQRRESGKERETYTARDDLESWSSDQRDMGIAERNGNKRRGRAAPPGRCHSCNRAETPEWRRGPDGARTLCNACGLHYAKLTRKTQGQKSHPQQGGTSSQGGILRPKSIDES